MVKIYTFVSLCVLLMAGFTKLQAQQICSPNAFTSHITFMAGGQQVCAVYVYNMLPNSLVQIEGPPPLYTNVPSASGNLVYTDAFGYACFVYPCGTPVFQVRSCNANGCCTKLLDPSGSPLPVKIESFLASLNANNTVTLNWVSSVEIDSYHYSIERSNDGTIFSEAGVVKAAGSSGTAIRYSFTDNAALNGAAFYRLKQIDKDGSFEYSKIAYVNNSKSNGKAAKVFPNPFTSHIQVVGITSAELANKALVRVFNATGQSVAYRITGANSIALEPSAPRGLYIVKVKEQQFRLIKE
jgi:Secretion system C-terminal sorting domain